VCAIKFTIIGLVDRQEPSSGKGRETWRKNARGILRYNRERKRENARKRKREDE
jgi:hypothetical protein